MTRGEGALDARVQRLGKQLGDARGRGLDRLDVKTHGQSPVPTPDLDTLADIYATAVGLSTAARTAKIKTLLADALDAYKAKNLDAAELIRSLFFVPEGEAKKIPTEMLRDARKLSGQSETDFRTTRKAVFEEFAEHLVPWVFETAAEQSKEPTTQQMPESSKESTPQQAAEYVPERQPTDFQSEQRTEEFGSHWGIGLWMVISLILSGLAAYGVWTFVVDNRSAVHYSAIAQAGGVTTYKDPKSAKTKGPKIKEYQKVEVSCRVYAVPFASVFPNGYWYRIKSEPWNDQYYAPVNNFVDGVKKSEDPRNVISRVPEC